MVMLVAVYYVLNTECYKNVFDLRNKNDCLQKPGINAWALADAEGMKVSHLVSYFSLRSLFYFICEFPALSHLLSGFCLKVKEAESHCPSFQLCATPAHLLGLVASVWSLRGGWAGSTPHGKPYPARKGGPEEAIGCQLWVPWLVWGLGRECLSAAQQQVHSVSHLVAPRKEMRVPLWNVHRLLFHYLVQLFHSGDTLSHYLDQSNSPGSPQPQRLKWPFLTGANPQASLSYCSFF